MKFSITIPAYKAAYLKECIESILAQTYTDFELIIVNDASPEDLTSIINTFNDPRIHYYINEKNCGAINVVDNWNKCLSYATGDYIICMGDDDKLLPCCLEEYKNLIEKYPNLDIYHGLTEIINENSNLFAIQESRPEHESVWAMIYRRWHGCHQYIGDFLFKTSKLRAEGGFFKLPLAWGSDDISAYKIAFKLGISNTQIPVFQYRVNKNNISNTNKTKNFYIARRNGILGQHEWYASFLQNIPTSPLDYKYWKLLKEEFTQHCNNGIDECIKVELSTTFWISLFYWLRNKRKYHLTLKRFFVCILIVIIKKFYHKN